MAISLRRISPGRTGKKQRNNAVRKLPGICASIELQVNKASGKQHLRHILLQFLEQEQQE